MLCIGITKLGVVLIETETCLNSCSPSVYSSPCKLGDEWSFMRLTDEFIHSKNADIAVVTGGKCKTCVT